MTVLNCFFKLRKQMYIHKEYIKLFKTDSDLCPYKPLRKLIMNRKSSNATEKDPLFVEEHNIALSRNYFIIKLKALLSCLCFVHCDYSGHSYGQQGDDEKCDLLNKYFSFISSLEDANVPLPDIELKTDNFLRDIVITTEEIVDIIKIINPNKESGPDIISHKMINICPEKIAAPLQIILNKSLLQCTYPTSWKIAHVIAIFKKGDKSLRLIIDLYLS